MNTVAERLPAGLIGAGIEFYFIDGELLAAYRGQSWQFNALPLSIIRQLQDQMESDLKAMELFEKYGPKPIMDRMEIYYKCSSGGFDHLPDFIEGKHTPESWNCGCNGNCILAARFRNGAETKNGVLTKREIEVIRTICSEPFPTSTYAAHILSIQEKTLDNHKQSIYKKTGVQSIQELTALAIKSGWL